MSWSRSRAAAAVLPAPRPEELNPGCVIQMMGLSKRYGDVIAVKNLNLDVRSGEVLGFLGPNGSGKTTTILMTLGLTEPTGGWVRVLGYDPLRDPLSVKRKVGYMPDSVGFYDQLTAVENLDYTGTLAGLDSARRKDRIAAVLEQMQLSEVARKKVGTYSRGMRQRLGLAEVLVKEPELIILDEPTSGLDPEAAREFLVIIRSLKVHGITILLSSHLLHQVQAICDRVCLFHNGDKVLEGSVDEITRQVVGGTHIVSMVTSGRDVRSEVGAVDGVLRVQSDDEGRLTVEADRDVRADISRVAVVAGARLLSLADTRPSLDDVYARYFEQLRAENTHEPMEGTA